MAKSLKKSVQTKTPKKTTKIVKPTLVVDCKRVHKNIDRMISRAKRNKVALRPHFKTHQSLFVGDFYLKKGIKAITVSSLSMAEKFAESGKFKDILIGVPVNILEIPKIDSLAKKVSLHVFIDSQTTLDALKKIKNKIHAWIEIDVDYHRTGLDYRKPLSIKALALEILKVKKINLEGIYVHAGNSYDKRSQSASQEVFDKALSAMEFVQGKLKLIKGFEHCKISFGDTPSCSKIEDWTGIDQATPGNFVYYDFMQHQIRACAQDDIAVAVACPVIGKYPERKEIVIYGGAVHLSKDSVHHDKFNKKVFGVIAKGQYPKTWGSIIERAYLKGISQEHGVIVAQDEKFFDQTKIGDLLYVLPIHSCLAADKHLGEEVFINQK